MPYRLFISNILNFEPFRESEIAKVDYFGLYEVKDRQKKWVFSHYYHIPDVCFPHQYPKKREDNEV